MSVSGGGLPATRLPDKRASPRATDSTWTGTEIGRTAIITGCVAASQGIPVIEVRSRLRRNGEHENAIDVDCLRGWRSPPCRTSLVVVSPRRRAGDDAGRRRAREHPAARRVRVAAASRDTGRVRRRGARDVSPALPAYGGRHPMPWHE